MRPTIAGRAQASDLAAERDEDLVLTRWAHDAREARFHDAAVEQPTKAILELAAQCAGEVAAPAAIAASIEKMHLRAPSEAEWEYLARGGRTGEPTFRGPALHDSAAWFEVMRDLGASGANAFGLWLFGLDPELCADAWHTTHDGIPLDGSPRRGSGPRTTRGGAAQLYPWQDTGEWHLLLTAMRAPQSAWQYALCVRPTLAIRFPLR